MKRYKTCHAIYWQKARIKRKVIDGSERLTGVCVCQWVKCPKHVEAIYENNNHSNIICIKLVHLPYFHCGICQATGILLILVSYRMQGVLVCLWIVFVEHEMTVLVQSVCWNQYHWKLCKTNISHCQHYMVRWTHGMLEMLWLTCCMLDRQNIWQDRTAAEDKYHKGVAQMEANAIQYCICWHFQGGVALASVNMEQNFFDVFLTVHHSIDLFQVTNLMHTSFIL